ncbi:MBL fold metallo-hydrolase [Tenacibaculum finnmarkense]|uniref:MBL fold metallo-hydrolase n=1 Tax=Tenacibaculum finnmarkense genomovar finnmarkense TaxID=1458503 RepID=A0AAP1RDX0_9FLAO|nr:MBL fold metallo-hydrolase [Tenacibaculum finnmarkense]MBE7651559.1 MBL fold metallo-hydrolase [Tenacibaculum finnmarkense genomovar finnmarkense]MBE7694092.1 MBL fold metallo-hydrolase [Tenacibaculum finnmarkense genomovar finnmarkense]MCD8426602.1 MBL fold metallo-hydrolase [Tenacibaculum finnmarkense genomovar finnmarkense]MCG8730394.1 MBL fold metallo-hydrolase [Tenacibaculum finnmarkense]MCG8750824.1 MBL fold metallo-hydrolase [Tenacibaculum finnmarkense]
MKIEQIYTGCLAQGAYYIESEGEVAIIDPLREVESYIKKATQDTAKINYIFETHFHADFVSGHVTLAEKTGATIVYGPTAKTTYKSHIATDGEVFKIGKITITALHTPGHTMESTSYLLKDENGKNHALFSGDTLFLGDVGRPDLAQKGALTIDDLAGFLYDSLRTKIMTLEDQVIVYPAHGAGSACGKNLSKETIGTIGDQKKNNYALRENMTKAEFIKEVTDGLLPPPAYFPLNVKMNKEGYESIDDVIKNGAKSLSVADFEKIANTTEAIILDVRHQSEFIKGFIPRSIFIGLGGTFAPWVGALIKDVKQPILLVTPEGEEEMAITRLSRVGFDNVLGYLEGSFNAWKASDKEIDTLRSVSADVLEDAISKKALVFDARKPGEYAKEHIVDVPSTPLDFLNDHIEEFPKTEDFYVHCAGGYRSVIAASILKARGYHNVIDVSGGFAAIRKTSIERTVAVCPSTLK